MTLAVSTIINYARDMHPALSPENAPVPLALRSLSEIQRDLVGEITRRIPAYFATDLEVAMASVTFADGIDLTTLIPGGWLDITESNVVYANTPTARVQRANFVPWEQRDMGVFGFPAYTLRNDKLLLLGIDTDWSQVETFILTYTPLCADLVIGSNVILPDEVRRCMATMLANEWLGRLVGNPAFDIDSETAGYWEQRAGRERESFLKGILQVAQRQSYRVRDTMGRL